MRAVERPETGSSLTSAGSSLTGAGGKDGERLRLSWAEVDAAVDWMDRCGFKGR